MDNQVQEPMMSRQILLTPLQSCFNSSAQQLNDFHRAKWMKQLAQAHTKYYPNIHQIENNATTHGKKPKKKKDTPTSQQTTAKIQVQAAT